MMAVLLLATFGGLSRCNCGDDEIIAVTPGTCEPDFVCETGFEYRLGECRPSRCQVDADCCPSQRCNRAAGFCSDQFLSCARDEDCAENPGQACIRFRGEMRCAYPNATGTMSAAGTERCDEETDCAPGTTCLGHRCLRVAPCGEGCRDGEACELDTNRCVTISACSESCGEGEILVLDDPDTMSGAHCCAPSCSCTRLPPVPPGEYAWHASLAAGPRGVWVVGYDPIYGDLVAIEHDLGGLRLGVRHVDGFPATGPLTGDPLGPRGGRVESGPDVGEYASLAIDAAGGLHVAYYDRTEGDLKYANLTGGVWSITAVDTRDDVGRYTSIALDPDGVPRIAYMMASGTVPPDPSPRTAIKLAVASRQIPTSAADWSIRVLESRPLPDRGEAEGLDDLVEGVGLFADMAITSTGSALIAYYDRTARRLRLAVETSTGTFRIRTIDGDGTSGSLGTSPVVPDVGQHVDLALGRGDHAGLAYYDATNEDLVYYDVAAHTREIVDDGLSPPDNRMVGADASLIFDPNGEPAIAYQDPTRLDLLYARRSGSGGAWSIETLSGAPPLGEDQGRAAGFYASQARLGSDAYIASVAVAFNEDGRILLDLGVLRKPL